MKMLVSVVTLVYKRFDKLYNAIGSVLTQDYPEIEYIISDDGSPFFPEEEIREFIEVNKKDNLKNLVILTHKKNQGTVRNINDAYRHATGEIIVPLSADDAFYDASVLGRITAVYRKRTCDALIVGRAFYDEHGKFVRNIPGRKEQAVLARVKDNKEQYRRFITGRFFEVCSGSVLSVRTSFIKNWGYFDTRYTLLEDAPFFAQYLWDNYLECAFDIIGIKYSDGGVSSSTKHPLLSKDDELFRNSDRITHMTELRFFERTILRSTLARLDAEKTKGRIIAGLLHPIGVIGNKLYKLRLMMYRE